MKTFDRLNFHFLVRCQELLLHFIYEKIGIVISDLVESNESDLSFNHLMHNIQK